MSSSIVHYMGEVNQFASEVKDITLRTKLYFTLSKLYHESTLETKKYAKLLRESIALTEECIMLREQLRKSKIK